MAAPHVFPGALTFPSFSRCVFRRVQQDFRLHQADVLVQPQSHDVSRINRMFVVQQHQQQQNSLDSNNKVVTHRGGGSALKGRPIIIHRKMETLPEW